MDKGIIAVRNEFEKAVRTAEEKYLSRNRNAILSQFGVAKGIIFVMQEFDTSLYLDQQKMHLHRNMTGSMMEMMNASDGMYD